MGEHWSEQYEDTAKRLELLGVQDAADDIRVLVTGLLQYEREEGLKREPHQEPKFQSAEEIKNSNLPVHVEFPRAYFPGKVGPGSFDPQMMYLHALAMKSNPIGGMIPYETKCWVILWLLDHIDWERWNV